MYPNNHIFKQICFCNLKLADSSNSWSLLPCRLIARQLAKYHAIHAHNGWVPQSDLWLKMGKYFALIPKYLKDPEQNAR